MARQQIAAARSLQVAPTLFLELRLPTVQYLYDDTDHPERRTGEISFPPYTREDRALLAGLEAYEASLCRCGIPTTVAWHSEMDGYYESDPAVCHACSELQGKQVVYATNFRDTRDSAKHGPMPAFIAGETITAPETPGP